MIVSFKYNYIYFRPKKTGSSSIAAILQASLDEGDIRRSQALPADIRPDRRSVHMKAADIRNSMPEAFWNRCFKFASERHPYEKAVSLAFFRLGKQQQKRQKTPERSLQRFPALLARVVAGGEYRGFDYYAIDGKPVVNEFIRHETLEKDLRWVAARLGIPVPVELPRNKSTFRLDPRPARDILTEEQRHTIYQNCRQEFELLGYEP